jgi:hypothetical protein
LNNKINIIGNKKNGYQLYFAEYIIYSLLLDNSYQSGPSSSKFPT